MLVGLTTLLPVAVALLGLLWPPAARGDRAFAAVAWVGLAAVLLLVPSIAGLVRQVVARGPQTLLPSWEAVYPWFLALLATALFGGLGVARRVLGITALRRRRLELGLIVAVAAAALSGSVFAAAAVANDLALRQVATSSSRFGPTVATTDPLSCSDPQVGIGDSARVVLTVRGDVDGRPIGTVDLHGERDGTDTAWTADVATSAAVGQFGLIRRWDDVDACPWRAVDAFRGRQGCSGTDCRRDAVSAGRAARPRPGGLRRPPCRRRTGRRRRIAASTSSRAPAPATAGSRSTARRSGPRSRRSSWLVGATPICHRWRGELDYWVFLDGQLGRMTGSVNGDAAPDPGGRLESLDAILRRPIARAPGPSRSCGSSRRTRAERADDWRPMDDEHGGKRDRLARLTGSSRCSQAHPTA